jgi:hypothetical protein
MDQDSGSLSSSQKTVDRILLPRRPLGQVRCPPIERAASQWVSAGVGGPV